MADPILGAAVLLRDALSLAMAECGAPSCRISLSPTSATPIDICCDCGDGDGQAWVSVIRAMPKATAAAGYSPCGFETEVLFVLGISRCAHTINDQGEAPSGAELNEDTAKLLRDYQIMLRAVLTHWVPEMDLDKQMYRVGDYDVHPVRGGCLAATLEVFATFANCMGECP